MVSKRDFAFEGQSRNKMRSAQAAPKRAELELNGAENDAKQVEDAALRKTLLAEIKRLRAKLLKD